MDKELRSSMFVIVSYAQLDHVIYVAVSEVRTVLTVKVNFIPDNFN